MAMIMQLLFIMDGYGDDDNVGVGLRDNDDDT